MIACTWMYSTAFAIMPALNIGLSSYVPEGFLTSCTFDYLDKSTTARIFMFTFFLAAWMLPFTIIIYCYTNILRAVTATNEIRATNKSKNRNERKLAMVVMNIIALWFLAWTPYAIVALIGISGNEHLLTPWISMIPAIFCKSAAALNPYLYSWTHPRFKTELQRFMLGKQPTIQRNSTVTRTVVFSHSKHRAERFTEIDITLKHGVSEHTV